MPDPLIAAGGYGKASLAADLAGLMDAMSMSEATMIGCDLGGGRRWPWPLTARSTAAGSESSNTRRPATAMNKGCSPAPDWRAWQRAFFKQHVIAVRFIAGREREPMAWCFRHWSDNPDAVGRDDFEVQLGAATRDLQGKALIEGHLRYWMLRGGVELPVAT